MRNQGTFRGLAWVVACVAVQFSCAGGARDGETPPSPATTETASETPSQAANDPATDEGTFDPATAVGAVKGVPAPTNTSAIEAVANYYTELPGFDLTVFDTQKREKFLHRVNSEMCTCGCKNDTLARCLVNDPKCPTVKGLVQTVYDEMRSSK